MFVLFNERAGFFHRLFEGAWKPQGVETIHCSVHASISPGENARWGETHKFWIAGKRYSTELFW